jgi:hypothetical protein
MKATERTIDLVREVENTMDEHNGMFGDMKTLCCFCGANKHDGFSGIIHNPQCLIKEIRDWLLIHRDDAVHDKEVVVSEQEDIE